MAPSLDCSVQRYLATRPTGLPPPLSTGLPLPFYFYDGGGGLGLLLVKTRELVMIVALKLASAEAATHLQDTDDTIQFS